MTEPRFYLSPSIPHITWFREVDPNNIIGNLEYSYFIKNNFKKNVTVIGVSDTQDYFALDSTPKSFLNPVNLKVMFDNYMEMNIPPIEKRFNLVSQTQIDSIIAYFH
jgi:hypothetical protein